MPSSGASLYAVTHSNGYALIWFMVLYIWFYTYGLWFFRSLQLKAKRCSTSLRPGKAKYEHVMLWRVLLINSPGLHHEQCRTDRDTALKVLLENVPRANRHNFNIERGTFNFGVPYDYCSVMHYGGKSFSSNGGFTVITRNQVGEGNMPKSDEDIMCVELFCYWHRRGKLRAWKWTWFGHANFKSKFGGEGRSLVPLRCETVHEAMCSTVH